MGATFFFYDLETCGFNPRQARIMQFAGQRTDLELNPVGEPVNMLLKITDDILPEPDAILMTGITPQATIAEGVTEAEFLRFFETEVATPGTIFVGYNTIRFDDEFMRCLHYRNFYDPYEWQWQEQRSKWDLLDVVRMMRALRPEGVEWAYDINGQPTNRLELIAALNKLEHEQAHDALSDVIACIAVARLIRNKQTKLFDYLFSMRDKRKVAELVEANTPFVYTSGQYPSEFQKTTAVIQVCPHPKYSGCAMVYDLRHDPANWTNKTPEQLAEAWRWKKDSDEPRVPVKKMQYNRCPAVAPIGVLDEASQKRLQIDLAAVKKHAAFLKQHPDFAEKLCQALEILERKQQATLTSDAIDVDDCLYDGFFQDGDKQAMRVVRAAAPEQLGNLGLTFKDHRLEALLPLYKARNYPKVLSDEERQTWENYRARKLTAGGENSKLAKYFVRLQDIVKKGGLTPHQEYLIEELRLYAESIMPGDTLEHE